MYGLFLFFESRSFSNADFPRSSRNCFVWTRKHHGFGTNPMCLKIWKFVADFDMTNMSPSLKCESGNCTIQCISNPPWHKGSLLSNTTIGDIHLTCHLARILLPGDTATWWERGSSLTKAFGNCRTRQLKWPSESDRLAPRILDVRPSKIQLQCVFYHSLMAPESGSTFFEWTKSRCTLWGYKSLSRIRVLNIALHGSIFYRW